MADTKPSAMTEDTTPDATDVVWVQTAAGDADKRIPLSSFATQAELDAHDTDTTSVHGIANTAALETATGAQTKVDTHVNDTSAAHAASAISADSTTLVGTGTDVQAVLEELDNGIADHLADATAAHAASAISADSTTLVGTGTDVQAVLEELDNSITDLPQLEQGVRTTIDSGNPGFLSTDVILSEGISGGDTLTGGTGSAQDLTLASTAHGTRGTINLRDQVELISEDKTHDTASGVYVAMDWGSARTITFNHGTAGSNQLQVFRITPTVVFDVNSATFAAFLWNVTPTIKNVNGETRTIQSVVTMRDFPTYTADGATVTFTGHTSFSTIPTIGVINSGTANMTNVNGFTAGLTINASATVTTRTAYAITDSAGAGTVTTMIGLDIPTLTHAGTSIGFRNASTEVNTPTTKAITVAGDTIPITARLIRLNNTSGGSVTLTSAPTMADGQNGQIITLLNTSANNVVIQDQGTLASSNMRLTATGVTIGPRQSVQLMYSTTVGDWVQTGALVAVI